MELSKQILSEITVHMKYAKHLKDKQRRETWDEIIERNKLMHIEKYPEQKDDIEWAYQFVADKKVLPSMRSLQFAGHPITINPTRMFNCSFMTCNDLRVFQETFFLLLSGCGVGLSVQQHHVEQLPEIRKPNPNNKRRYLVGDSITGWADSVKALMKSYFGEKNVTYEFDFADIRPKGAPLLTSGGVAPGGEPLSRCLFNIKAVLDRKENGSKLSPIEVFDIMCYIAEAVLAGGIRRASLITLFSLDDNEMMSAKTGQWYLDNPQRGMSNNSVVLVRSKLTKETFDKVHKYTQASNCGEPGISLTNNAEYGFNPLTKMRI